MGKFKVGDIVKQKEGVLYPHIKEIDVVVDVGKVFSPSLGKEVDYIELLSHPSAVKADNFEVICNVYERIDLLKYCKDNNFPIREMNENDFRKVENTARYKFYELGLEIRKLGREVLKSKR